MICLFKTSLKSNFFHVVNSFLEEINMFQTNTDAIKSQRFDNKSVFAVIIFVYVFTC